MARVLTLGMAVLDHVFHLDAFPRAGEKYRAHAYRTQIGGPATMAALAVRRLGGSASLCTRLGDDANSQTIMAELEREGVDWSPSVIVPGAVAPVSSVYVDEDGERQIVNFRGEGLAVSADMLSDRQLDGVDAVLVDPRWPEGAEKLISLARDRDIPCVVDAENDLEALEGAMAKATHIAFSTQGLKSFSGEEDVVSGLKYCAGRYSAWAGVTHGEKGVIYLDQGAVAHVAAFAVLAVDTLGAGDVWHGAFALGLGEGRSVFQAVRFANAAAALKCRNGTGPEALPGREETMALMSGEGVLE
ncbi:PfkB family carbohydrate kinase [Oricola thermophila]|uniref:Sugar kinase n=1 Tax=Oricola thermophila TaxID=2742145 RepID=A0A6N1VGQ2_9HYPH|nr:PfkB family carbohydrate kinase [Oricola thermophila]QKV20071.1 sugar kinase [Oricola thermophila]